jgi:preprotein translocase subunit SecG
MTGRGAANFLTRATAALAAGFFATSLFLSLVGARSDGPRSVLETPTGKTQTAPDKKPTEEGPKLSLPDSAPDTPKTDETPKVPQSK